MGNLPKPVVLVVAIVVILIAVVLFMKKGGDGEPVPLTNGPPAGAMATMKQQADKAKK